MLQENIKNFRKERGLTQEELAIRLNVVRQTVSKWEKGLSVPDADMLQRLADVLDVSVNQLLGEDREPERNRNEVAEQLARINEQLAIRNRRSKRIWTIVGMVLAGFILVQVLILILNFAPSGNTRINTSMEVTADYRVLEDKNGNVLIIEKADE